MTDERKNQVFGAGVELIALVDLVFTYSMARVPKEVGSLQAAVLLALPAWYLIACAFFIAKNRPRLVIVSALLVSEVIKLIFEALYFHNDAFTSRGLAALSTSAFVAGTATFAFVLTATARLPSRSKGKKTSSRMQFALMWMDEKRLHAVCIAFVFFVEVTLLLAFAIAFDDKSCITASAAGGTNRLPYHALFPTLSVRDNSFGLGSNASQSKQKKRLVTTFFFVKDSAELGSTWSTWQSMEGKGSYCHDIMARTDSTTILERNHAALCTIVAWWADLAITPRARVNAILVGHASNDLYPPPARVLRKKPDHPRYQTNYELSASRAQQVFLLLHRLASECEVGRGPSACKMVATRGDSLFDRVGWQVVAGAEEQQLLDGLGSPSTLSNDERYRSVDVEWIPSGSEGTDVNLIDYLYFMVYTITTTGYGDLIPASPTTKLITSAANFIEVLFMALVFSLLLNADGGKSSDEVSKQPAAEGAQQ